MLRHYETTIIFHPELPDESVEELLEKTREIIQKHDGEILHVDHWGRRRMAYEIKKQQRGNYVVLAYKAGTEVTRALEKFFRVTDNVIKFLSVRLEQVGVDALEARIADIAKKTAAAAEAAARAAAATAAAVAEAASAPAEPEAASEPETGTDEAPAAGDAATE